MHAAPILNTQSRFRIMPAIALAAMCAGFAPAQPPAATTQPQPETQPQAQLPTARSIIDRHVAAIGGQELIRKTKSMHLTCKLEVAAQNIAGDLEVLAAAPNKLIVKSVIPGFGEATAGFDGALGWTIDSMSGPQIVLENQLQDLREKADFFDVLHDEANFKSVQTVDVSDFEGRPCYKIKLVRASGREVLEFFDVESGLFAGRIMDLDSPIGTVQQISVETEYRRFGDRMLATRIIQKMMGQEVAVTVLDAKFDSLDDSVFAPPAEVMALVAKPAATSPAAQ